MEELSHELGRDAGENSEGALRVLMAHDWPGNVREPENAEVRESARPMAIPPGMTMQEMERLLIVETLRRAGGNIKESAATLGIDRSTLYEKIKKYEIPR